MSEADDAASPAGPASAGERGRAEATGETVGEAKWAALRELERRLPGLEKGSVRFQILSEGQRGLLGVGYSPARVVAEVSGPLPERPRPAGSAEGPAADRLRELLEEVRAGLALDVSVSVSETDSALVGRFSGPDVGLVIGRRGQTIDAIQYLARAVLAREPEPRKEVVVDAAGYRGRRREALERIAERAARDALSAGTPVVLEPMPASERKIVHLYLHERGGVTTASEGEEPQRHVIVVPATVSAE
jgi:spoIIIJ-associated protein